MEAGDFSAGGADTVPGGHVTLVSPNLALTGPACLRWFHYMYYELSSPAGGILGNLTVGTLRTGSNATLRSVEGRQSQAWNCSYVTIPQGSSPFQVFVRASVGTHSDLGDIAVDDIAVFNTSCESIASQICVLNTGVSTTQPPQETSPTSSTGGLATSSTVQTSQGTSNFSASTAAATTSSPTEVVDQSSLLFLLIPGVVVVLAIPVAFFCFLKRRKKDASPVFRPYVPPADEHEVYDELGPVSDIFHDNDGYTEVDITNETSDARPPVPCSRNSVDLLNRDPDAPREHAPPPPVDIYITPVNDDAGPPRKSSLPRPVSQHSYMEMMELEPAETGPGGGLTPGLRVKEPGSPTSQRSYLDMQNQTSFRSRAQGDSASQGGEDYENAETKEDYVNAAGQEDYLEPVARMPVPARPSSSQPVPAQPGLAPPDQDVSDSDSYCDPQLGPAVHL